MIRLVRTAAAKARFAGLLALALSVLAPQTAVAQTARAAPRDSQEQLGLDGEVKFNATEARRDLDLSGDRDRSGFGAGAMVGWTLPAGKKTTVRLEGHGATDRYGTSYGGEVQIKLKASEQVTLSITASGTKDAVVLESLNADQAAVRGGIELRSGDTTIEGYARHRWRSYHDISGGTGQGWQFGARVRQRFGSYHWFELAGSHDRIDDGGGRHGYRRTSLAVDYSQPVAKRLRLVMGVDYRTWTYDGRWVDDNPAQPQRQNSLVRPELGLSWSKTKGFYARATTGYDFYDSNDARYRGDGHRLRLTVGFRF